VKWRTFWVGSPILNWFGLYASVAKSGTDDVQYVGRSVDFGFAASQ